MTNDKKTKPKKNPTVNKGVRISDEELELQSLPSRISGDTEPHSPKNISISNVREELKNVIETMGPNTTSTGPENDETYSQIERSYVEIQEISSKTESVILKTEEDSQMTEYNVSQIVEFPTQTIDTSCQTCKRDFLCPNVYNNDNIPPHNFCPHYMMQNEYFHPQQNEYYHRNIPQFKGLPPSFVKHTSFERVSRLAAWLGLKNNREECRNCSKNCDLYKINIEQAEDESPPRKLVFDLVSEPPKAETKNIGINTSVDAFTAYRPKENVKVQITKSGSKIKKELKTERVDIYYFDHGNAEYYKTTDLPPIIKTEYVAERTDYYTKKFWAEFFGTFHIGVSFVTSFLLQFLRFILQAIFRPLTIGIIQIFSDYFFKPGLAITFNGILQPPMIFLYNFLTSFRDVCAPIAETLGYFIREISVMCKAIRLVQIDNKKAGNTEKTCGVE